MHYNEKKIELFGTNSDVLCVMHAGHDEGEKVWQACQSILGSNPFTLAAISNLNWERELSPWNAPPVFKKSPEFSGGADVYIEELVDILLPSIIKKLEQKPTKIYIVGYSLAGLFALYSTYKTDVFCGVVSASSSMWYPGFLDFVLRNNISNNVNKIYLSLGSKESKTKNLVMQTVEERTRHIYTHYLDRRIETIYEENEGGHFSNTAMRLAKGISWIVNEE